MFSESSSGRCDARRGGALEASSRPIAVAGQPDELISLSDHGKPLSLPHLDLLLVSKAIFVLIS